MRIIVLLCFAVSLVYQSVSVARTEDITQKCPVIKHLDPTLNNQDKPVLVFGKIHGTNQAPEFVFGVACRAVELGHSVVVALEINKDNQPYIDTYLESRGTDFDKIRLLSSHFWRANETGHSSFAIFSLIENVRNLRQDGNDITVIAYTFFTQEGMKDTKFLGHEYEAMRTEKDAKLLNQLIETTTATKIIIMTGDANAVKIKSEFAGVPFLPLASYLPKEKYSSFSISYTSGYAWVCMMNSKDSGRTDVHISTVCESFRFPGNAPKFLKPNDGYELIDLTPDEGFDNTKIDGVFFVGRVSASKPAYLHFGGVK